MLYCLSYCSVISSANPADKLLRSLVGLSNFIKRRKKYFEQTNPPPSPLTSTLVKLINGLIHNTGLLSYMSVLKVHWAANFAALCFVITCVFQAIALFTTKDDLDSLFECISVLAFCSIGVLKLNSLRRYHENWRFLLNQISKLENELTNGFLTSEVEYESDNENGNNFSSYINNYNKRFKTIFRLLQRMYSFTCFMFILSPFWEHLYCKILGNECLTYPHILPGCYFLDHFGFYGYLIAISSEFIAALYCVSVHVAFDLAAVGVMTFCCGQFSLLYDYSARIGGKGKVCNISKKREDRARFRIKHCHRIHLLLVKTVSELDKLLRGIIGLYFFVATLTLCSVAVRLKPDTSAVQLLSLLQYMCGTLTQLFIFCRYGDAVFNASSVGAGEGPFAAAHWSLSPRIRRDLILLGAGMVHPLHLRAGPFNVIDLPSFVLTVRAAYSYYAILGKKN